jgi:hypothetical protein
MIDNNIRATGAAPPATQTLQGDGATPVFFFEMFCSL